MTLVLSSSSPLASIALFSPEGELLASAEREVPMAASGALVEMALEVLQQNGITTKDIDLFGADIGPGSFTGTRVAVTLAKTYAYVAGKKCFGVSSFDLIDCSGTVAIPSKKGEYFIRRVGLLPVRTSDRPQEPLVGFGPWFVDQQRPRAKRAIHVLNAVTPLAPEQLVPEYWIEPSISVPKKRMGGHVE